MGNSQTGEQLYQEDHVLLRKFSAPQQTSQSGDPAKGLSIPRQSDFDGQWDLITELPKQWGNRDSWRAQTNLVHTRTQGKGAVTPQETESDLPVSVLESRHVSIVACLGIRGTSNSSPLEA